MYKRALRFMQTSPYSDENRHEHLRQHEWRLEDFEDVKRLQIAALASEKLIRKLVNIIEELGRSIVDNVNELGSTPKNEFNMALKYLIHLAQAYPKNGLENIHISVDVLIGEPPNSLKEELKIYIQSCLRYAFEAAEKLKGISELVKISEAVAVKADGIRNEIDRICRNVNV